jgi:hypothetical protein
VVGVEKALPQGHSALVKDLPNQLKRDKKSHCEASQVDGFHGWPPPSRK